MSSLAIKNTPRNWDDILNQPAAVKLARLWLETNDFPNLIFLSGSPGIGKTSIASMICNSIHCLNRKEGESQPCGTCEICLRDPRNAGTGSNVIWVQPGTTQSMAKQIELALSEANSQPYGFNEDHRDWKVIVFDELQSIQAHLQKLLYFPDLARTGHNRVVFIAVTMSEESLKPVDLDAFKSRGSYIKLKTPTENQVFIILRSKYPNYPTESLSLIAKFARGNIRSAYNTLERCVSVNSNLDPSFVSVELQFVDRELRKKIWRLLENASNKNSDSINCFKQLNVLWESISTYVDERMLAEQMVEDLIASYEVFPNEVKRNALTLLMNQVSSSTPVRLNQFLKILSGEHLIEDQVFTDQQPSLEERIFE
jgi:DNA polymerase III gamma/tau subunit